MIRKLLVLILLTGMAHAQTKIMLLGDSITELDWQGGYRSQLYHLLQLGGYSFDFVGRSTTNHDGGNLGFSFPTAYWDHEGYSNATIEVNSTYTWRNHLRTALTAGRPDVVCVMLGTNDVFSTIRNATQVRDAMSTFLDSIWAFNPNTKVVLSTMPRVFGYATALGIIQSANALWPAMVATKQSAGRNITLVDNYAALSLSTDFVDGVHPSIVGYVKMATAWYPAVRAAISPGSQPTGTFSVSPDTLPVGGGNVTLTWTSNGATNASIDQGVGAVALNGNTTVTVGQTKTFTLTLSSGTGSRSYTTRVGVALPGGQGPQDITSQATIVALIPNPTGGGNPDIEVIRDGVTPAVGSSNVLEQFDTFTGGQLRDVDWIGYTFSTPKQFTSLIYQEGLDNQWGGCFETLQVQVRSNGQWTTVQSMVSTPPYPGSNQVNFETYQLNFNSATGDAIRIAGRPTGQGHYIGVAELRVLSTTTGVGPTPAIPKNYELMQNYPNPFNPTTTIEYSLPVAGRVVLDVFNVIGQHIITLVDDVKSAGMHSANFVATHLSNGVYFYSIRSGAFVETRKMTLLK